jgi:uncharacterized protein YggU (UPF0235/DUF167 family)
MVVEIKVKTNSKESKVEVKDNIYYVYTKSPAKENKANIEVIDLMAEYLNISKRNICIKRGIKSKKKILEIV